MLGFFTAPSARGTRNGRAYRNLPAGRKRLGIRIPRRAASSWSDCPHACRHDGGRWSNEPTDELCDFARGQPTVGSGGFAVLVSLRLFLDSGARKFYWLQGIENSRNAEIFALVSPREARKWIPPTRTSSAPPHLIWSRHLSRRARKFAGLQSIENSRNEKIVAGCEIKSSQRRRPGGDRRG
jgi:hypothetical protein